MAGRRRSTSGFLAELILSEVATRVRVRAGARRAVAVARSLFDSRRYELLFIDSDVLESAFAFDADFRDCGYRMVP
jgi:hypothetical protein